MNLSHLFRQGLATIFLVGFSLAIQAASAFSIKTLKKADLRFPVIQGNDPKAVERINALLFVHAFNLELPHIPPQNPAQSLAVLPATEKESLDPLPALDFKVLRNDASVFSIVFEGEGCGAYCEAFHTPLAFDSASGRLLKPVDLFTVAGRKTLIRDIKKRNQQAIQAHLAKLRDPKHSSFETAEESRDAIEMYKECLSGWQEENPYDSVGDMEFQGKELVFVHGRCSNHMMRALDDLGDLRAGYSYAALQPWLSPYGRRLLLGEQPTAQPDTPYDQWLQGTIGGKTRITMYFENPDLDSTGPLANLSGYYFYDRYRKPLVLHGQFSNGKLTLDEYGADEKVNATMSLESDGSGGWRGQWQSKDGKTSLPMILAP